jgi:hypothetical protein
MHNRLRFHNFVDSKVRKWHRAPLSGGAFQGSLLGVDPTERGHSSRPQLMTLTRLIAVTMADRNYRQPAPDRPNVDAS